MRGWSTAQCKLWTRLEPVSYEYTATHAAHWKPQSALQAGLSANTEKKFLYRMGGEKSQTEKGTEDKLVTQKQ